MKNTYTIDVEVDKVLINEEYIPITKKVLLDIKRNKIPYTSIYAFSGNYNCRDSDGDFKHDIGYRAIRLTIEKYLSIKEIPVDQIVIKEPHELSDSPSVKTRFTLWIDHTKNNKRPSLY